MGFFSSDDYDRYDMRDDMRHAMEDDRRYNRRGDRYNDDEDVFEWWLKIIVFGAIILAIIGSVLTAAAGWIDAHFGTDLSSVVQHLLGQIFHK